MSRVQPPEPEYGDLHRAILLTYDEEYRRRSDVPELSAITVANALWFNGIRTLGQACQMTDKDLLLIKSIGTGRLERIRKACEGVEPE